MGDELGPIAVEMGGIRLLVDTELPRLTFNSYVERAEFSDTLGVSAGGDGVCFVAAFADTDAPTLVVAFRYEPAGGPGFTPGVLYVPETNVMFLGAGTGLRCYTLDRPPRRLWVDEANAGFWQWQRVGAYVLMSAELELAAWSTLGDKLRSTFVEPP